MVNSGGGGANTSIILRPSPAEVKQKREVLKKCTKHIANIYINGETQTWFSLHKTSFGFTDFSLYRACKALLIGTARTGCLAFPVWCLRFHPASLGVQKVSLGNWGSFLYVELPGSQSVSQGTGTGFKCRRHLWGAAVLMRTVVSR